ncbi:MAG: CerR family C-terminal domain-containing protein [Desulfuromonadaceae bacterium]|nr:CerR family C-terminal domain-containing protein [Desulfuromonadaceae bacterium]
MASQDPTTTKEKLLSVAIEVFVEKGYRDATLAEICRRAGANGAAVNYHFGSKETLYQEAWRCAFAASVQAHPQDGGVPGDSPATERLRGQIRALIKRIADDSSRDFFISQMELANPTGLLAEVMRSQLIPLREKTLALMRELLGPQASEQQVMFCEMSVISMCFHPMLMRRLHQKTPQVALPSALEDLDAFIEHVMQFSLAGIAAIKSGLPPCQDVNDRGACDADC